MLLAVWHSSHPSLQYHVLFGFLISVAILLARYCLFLWSFELLWVDHSPIENFDKSWYSSERLIFFAPTDRSFIVFFEGIVQTRLRLPHHVGVLQPNRSCCIICDMKVDPKNFLMPLHGISTHGPRISFSFVFFHLIIILLEVVLGETWWS